MSRGKEKGMRAKSPKERVVSLPIRNLVSNPRARRSLKGSLPSKAQKVPLEEFLKDNGCDSCAGCTLPCWERNKDD